MKHIAVYLRVSTEGEKNGREQDTAMQLLDIQKYLELKGLTNYKVYEDKGHRGGTKDRPALKEMMKDCRSGKVSIVICWKLDRLFRSMKFMLDHVTEFQELGIEFVSVKDNIDLGSASGRLLFQILSAFSEFEAATIRERVNAGLMNAKAKGVKLGRPVKPGHSVVEKLKGEGKSVIEIAGITGLSRQSVYRTLNKETQ
jgi:DNA invertase Pin-like site-specific DNA recombinase